MTNNNHLYSSQDARLSTLFGDIGFLGKIRRARDEYEETHSYDVELFLAWMETQYGIKITQNENGLTADHEVVDKQKYLVFELKFTI